MIDSGKRAQFDLTDEQRQIAGLAAEIAQREIAPHIAAWDREHTFPRQVFTALNDAGVMGILVPEKYGGVEAGYVAYALAVEEIARIDAGSAVTLSVHSMIASAINVLGNDEQKEQWLPRLSSGDTIAAFALTEPDCGSDAAALRATAKRDGESYVLNGRKQWCTNGSVAGVTMGMFRTGSGGARGVSAFLVPNDTAGIVVEKITEKLGIHTSNTCDLAFDGARIPANSLIAREGDGFGSAMKALAGGRIGIAAQATGILAACLQQSVAFAKDRVAFGRAIGAFEGVSFKIAQMAMDLDAARLLVYRAAGLADAGKPFVVEASKAKLFASTAARKHAAEALQIHGGYGYTTEFPVERYYRDAKITEIYEGTSEIQQIIIARSLLGKID